jgi:lysophospholipase L1-like esterase
MTRSRTARLFASLVVVIGAGLLTVGVGSLALTSAAAPSGHEVSHAGSSSCNRTLPAGTVVGIAATEDDGGYWIANNAGIVVACGDAPDFGGLTTTPAHPIVGIAATPDGGGFYLVASDGGVFTFGDAVFQGSTGAMRLNKPVVGMAVDPSTGGYWLVASDGGIFAFNAPYYGSTGSVILNRPVVGMAESNGGSGYWLVASDGGIFSFKAPFYGSAGSLRLNKPVVGMEPDLATGGYWLVASDGGIFSFNAPFYGSTGSLALNRPIVGMESNAAGTGSRFVASDGGVFDFGSSGFFGSAVAAIPVAPPPTPIAVMPLGDSITDGYLTPGGYRTELWQLLVNQDHDNISFVGSQSTGALAPGDPASSGDDEGHIGWCIGLDNSSCASGEDLSSDIVSWLNTYRPNIILLHAGTNDIASGDTGAQVTTNMDDFLDQIFTTLPHTDVVLAQIIPILNVQPESNYASMETAWQQYNAALPGLVSKYRSLGYNIQLVNMSDVLNPDTDYATGAANPQDDDFHPNLAGYDIMAQTWYPYVKALYASS